MKTKGVTEILLETHNWGSTVAFWRDLGYALEFETDHHSGRLRHPSGGPAIFVAERPHEHALQVVLGVAVTDATRFAPPRSGSVVRPFEKQHWPALQMLLADPDGRQLAVEAPLPSKKSEQRRNQCEKVRYAVEARRQRVSIMQDEGRAKPDTTAVRVALWRAMHVEVDAPPHVLEDEIGLKLAAPDDDWRRRPDMNPQFTSLFRASIVARARFIEDLVFERVGDGHQLHGQAKATPFSGANFSGAFVRVAPMPLRIISSIAGEARSRIQQPTPA